MLDGILLVNKEEGITSFDVIRKIKKVLPKDQKIGHAGTLDPFATGLVVILLGKGTKLMNSFHGMKKNYEFTVEFGYETDTQDPTGKKIHEKSTDEIDKTEIEESLQAFLGEISQTPPKYSAKKVKGERAYKMAREGKEFELPTKQVTIYELILKTSEWPQVKFFASVSAGTYIRTLAVDIARSLDTFATTTKLKRTDIGNYSVDQAIDSTDISEGKVLRNAIPLNNLLIA